MWEGLYSTQLEIDGTKCNNLEEEGFKIQKKTWGHMSTNLHSTCHKKGKCQLYIYIYIYIYIYVNKNHC